MRTRLLVAAAAAVCLVVPSSALAGTRGMTVKVPKSITEGEIFTATYSGDTGPGDQAGGGFIINVRLVKGKTCPANAAIPKHADVVDLGLGNLFAPGAFSGADRDQATSTGKYAVCGYVTENASAIVYDLLYTGHTTVKKAKHLRFAKLPKIKNGVYTAATAATTGGNGDASVTFTVAGGQVVSASATGIPNVSCFPDFSTQTPVATAASSTTPVSAGSNPVYDQFHAAFTTPAVEEFDVQGGATSDTTILGAVSATSTDGSCNGGFAFTATRQK